jgi:hypothetical protein
MVIPPQLIAAAASQVKDGADKGDEAAPAGPVNVYTPEMLQNALDVFQRYQNQQNQLAGTPSYSAGGVTSRQASQMSQKEIKTREYAKYLTEQKGYTPENAQARAQQIASSSKENFKKDKEFSRFVRQGGSESLSQKKGGRIRAGTEFTPGGVDVSSQSEAMRNAMQGLGMQSLNAASGLPQGYANEEARALAARGGLANQAMDYLGQGIGSSGLFSTQEKALGDMKNKYLNDFTRVYEDSMRGATSDLIGSGFNSSNLAGEYLQDAAYRPQSDFLTDALAKLAGQEQSFLTQASGIGSQNLQNILGTFNTLGQNQGIGSVLGGVLNPGGAGLFTDPQSAQFANQLQQQAIRNRQVDQSMANELNTQPVSLMPEQPGYWGTTMGAVAGAMGPAGAGIAKKWGAPKYNVQ